jgi:hypothetical protein
MKTAVRILTILLCLSSIAFAGYLHYSMLDFRPTTENTLFTGLKWSLSFCFFMYMGFAGWPLLAEKIFHKYL